LHRRTKKSRPAVTETGFDTPDAYLGRASRAQLSELDESTPATPDTDAGLTGQFKIPKSKLRTRRTSGKSTTLRSVQSDERSESTHRLPTASALLAGRNSFTGSDPTLSSVLSNHRVRGVVATPPIVESDFEPALVAEDVAEVVPQHRRPTPLDTLSAQDASLPSPSLSPITAAANLHNASFTGYGDEMVDDDDNEVSSLDISQDSFRHKRQTSSQSRDLDLPTPLTDDLVQQFQPPPTLMDVPNMLDAFDAMPSELQTYVMYQLLRRCAKPTLRIISDVVNPALKCDFLDLLPLELSMNIISNFDVQTMCRAAQVSKKWRQIIDSDEKAWKTLLDKDDFVLPKGEVERAVKEGWGWQFPYGPDSHEHDLSARYGATPDLEASSPIAGRLFGEYTIPTSATRPKRKAAGKHHGHSSIKKRKLKTPSLIKSRTVAPWMKTLDTSRGPNGYANAAAMAIPNPNVGLPSLRNLHLYKSIYRRHYAIRNGWMEENNEPQHFAFRAHGRHVVTCLQFDTDKILTGSDDTKIHVYDTKSGALRSVLDGHEGGVWALQYDGNTLVSGSTDRSVRVWDIEKGKCLHVFQGHTSTVRCLVILKPTVIGEELDGTPIIMPKEPLIITGSRDSTLRVWRLPQPGDRSVIQTVPNAHDADNSYFLRALVGHHHSVRAIAAHGDTLVSGSYDTAVRVWKISTGDCVHRLTGHSAKVYSVVLDHERNRCISGSMDNAVKIWSLETGNMIHSLDGHTSLVGLLDLSHGRLVSAAADSTLRIWDPETGNCKSTLSAHTGAITCFQHDDQKVISGSDRTVKMWNVKTGECVRDLLTDLSGVWQVKFNERRCVAAVQRDNWTYLEVNDTGSS
jgi:F-box and WD-40 domain protein CDC4